MISSLILAASLWPTEVIQQCSPPPNATIVAVAESIKHEHLYCEIFTQVQDKIIHADYTYNAKVIAAKDLDYTLSQVNPQVKQIDFRTGERRESITNNQNITLFYQESTTSKSEEKSFPTAEPDAIDAGFNNFIIAHWDDLVGGKTIPLQFGSIPHQKLLPLKVSLKSPEKCTQKHTSPSAPICFWVDIDNALLRLVIGNIKLSYNEKRQLIQYDGVVNINDTKGKTQHAVIHYYYRNNNNEE